VRVKTGIDIIEVDRIKSSIEKLGEKFLKRVFTEEEIKYCNNKNKMKYQSFAARFAAKEAILKAISGVLENKYDISWLNIEILNDENGRPNVKFIDYKLDLIDQIDISLSHIEEYAIANCVVILK